MNHCIELCFPSTFTKLFLAILIFHFHFHQTKIKDTFSINKHIVTRTANPKELEHEKFIPRTRSMKVKINDDGNFEWIKKGGIEQNEARKCSLISFYDHIFCKTSICLKFVIHSKNQ